MKKGSESNILLDIGMHYVKNEVPKISNETCHKVKDALNNFISGKIKFSVASELFMSFIGNKRPLKKIEAILKIAEKPLPDSNEEELNSNSLNARKKTRSWTQIEDQRLLAGIHHYGLDNWVLVSIFVGNGRTRAQCAQRWFRGLDPHISKMLWTKEEDKRLMKSYQVHGKKCWTKIAADVGTRSDAQCRYRYKQLTSKSEPSSTLMSSPPPLLPMQQVTQPIAYAQFPTPVTCNKVKLPAITSFINVTVPTQQQQQFNFIPMVLYK